MKKQLILFIFLLIISKLYSQVGINTSNPVGVFHVDGAKNNPSNGVPTLQQQSDDFVISKTGIVSIGTLFPSPYSSLEIESKKGLRLPQLTSEEISNLDAISSAELSKKNGLVVYNTTTNCVNFWTSSEWRELCGTSVCNPVTGTPQISPANPSLQVGNPTTFTVSSVSNATGYIWKVNGTVQSGQTQSTFSYTPSNTSAVTISVIATGCNNSETSETTVSATPTAFKCTQVGRFLKAGTSCKDYHYCHVYNGEILLNDYTCQGVTLFDKSIGNCQPTISSCPY